MTRPDRADDRPAALTARWVVPVAGEPVRGGTVELAADGTVAAVRDRPDDRGGAVDLGDAALLPGLVNAHCHLEFSDLAEPIAAPGTFADWVAATVAARRGRAGSTADRVNRGLAESLAAGVTAVGEIATAGWNAAELPPPLDRPRVVAFGEVIAPATRSPGSPPRPAGSPGAGTTRRTSPAASPRTPRTRSTRRPSRC